MGMNLYTLNGIHIGKRYAAGVWCWDCKREARLDESDKMWTCPKCGKKLLDKDVKFNPAYRELGFDRSKPRKHRGIDGASGFYWQTGYSGLGDNLHEVKKKLKRRKFVETEYGEKWSIKKFWEMFKDVIKQEVVNGEFS